MDLTINDVPIRIDDQHAQNIVRRFLTDNDRIEWRNQFEAWKRAHSAGVAVVGGSLLSGLQPGEKLIGSYAGPDGKTTVAILLPGEKKNVTWKDALAWARGQGGDLPNRIEALLLFQHHRDEFQREVYWTNEQPADDSSSAWCQSFGNGTQTSWPQDYELMARAVRRVAI